jgi:hypothetical protein
MVRYPYTPVPDRPTFGLQHHLKISFIVPTRVTRMNTVRKQRVLMYAGPFPLALGNDRVSRFLLNLNSIVDQGESQSFRPPGGGCQSSAYGKVAVGACRPDLG